MSHAHSKPLAYQVMVMTAGAARRSAVFKANNEDGLIEATAATAAAAETANGASAQRAANDDNEPHAGQAGDSVNDKMLRADFAPAHRRTAAAEAAEPKTNRTIQAKLALRDVRFGGVVRRT